MNVKKSLIMAALGVLLAVVSWAGASGETDFGADEDAFVKKSNDPNSNYNGEELRVKAGGSEINSYLKFTVSGVGTVTNAILKLYSEDVEMGVDVYEAASNEWSESIITWNTAPGSTGGSLDHVAVTTGWVEFDVTSLVTGDGTYSFVLKGDTAASTRNFSSSEGANPPVLTINEPWVDLTAPVISALSPADDESNVTVGSNLEVTFDENIAVGSGNITIKNLTDSNETIIPVTDAAQVSVAGSLLTIDPTANLDYLKDYAILIDAGAVEDPCSNLFAGITDEATWNFTTRESDFIAPAILGLTPADDANNAVVGADLAATFDENIVIAAGNITIKNLTDSNQIVIPVTDAAQVYVYGEVLMINPTNDLVASKEYAVWIDAGAIEDEAGNSFAGIADDSTWNFTAIAPNVPNIIIIYSDDHGYTDLGLFGIDNYVDTPNMDALAGGGVLMTNGYSSAPQCVPSRCGLMTGRIQNNFGIPHNQADAGEGANKMPRTYPPGSDMAGFPLLTIADRMKSLGYVTGFSGKWHCGPINDSSQLHDPRSRGFDEYWVGSNKNYYANFDLDGNSIPHQQINDTRNRVIVQGEAAEAFIERNANNKFFLYLPLYAPHVPLIDPNDPYYLNFPILDYPHYDAGDDDTRRKGLALIKAMDDAIGGVVQKLRALGLEENTLILFCGDNGAPLGIRWAADGTPEPAPNGGWNGSENIPMRGVKRNLLEGGIRVPMFAYWKGTIPPGQRIDEMVTALDFTATSVALGGGIIPPEFDGVDISPRLKDPNISITRTKPMFWDFEFKGKGEQAVRKGDWKLWRNADRDRLFNIAEDPMELFDLALKEPEKAAELAADLDAWCTPLLDIVLPPGEVVTAKNSLSPETAWGIHITGNQVAAPDPRYFTPYVDPTATPYPAPVTTMGMDFENFEILSEAWLSNDSPTVNWNQYYDFDDSGDIDINDLDIFTDIWLLGK